MLDKTTTKKGGSHMYKEKRWTMKTREMICFVVLSDMVERSNKALVSKRGYIKPLHECNV